VYDYLLAVKPRKFEIMGYFRFRMPGLSSRLFRLNVSKTGVSVTAGVPGAHLNYDLSGRREHPAQVTVGLPGTGVSYRQQIGRDAAVTAEHSSVETEHRSMGGILLRPK
jgi:hypothetical protein